MIGGSGHRELGDRNYLGFPRGVSGGTRFALMQRVANLSLEDDGIALTLSSGVSRKVAR